MPVHKKVALAAEDEAKKWGATVSFEDGRKHDKMQVFLDGERRVISITPWHKNDQIDFCVNWIRQDVRKLVKSIKAANDNKF